MKYRCRNCNYSFQDFGLYEVERCVKCGAPSNMLDLIEEHPDSKIKGYKVDDKYRCNICNYIYDDSKLRVKFNSLDDSYVCPLCGNSKNNFIKVPVDEILIDAEVNYEDVDKRVRVDDNNLGIARIYDKCINCGRCKVVCENIVGVKYDNSKVKEAICLNCGQCVINCPVGALIPKYNYKKVESIINDVDKYVIAFTAPAVRVSIGDAFGYPEGTNLEGKMVSALKRLGFDKVFDVSFGADITIMEEANELIDRIKNNNNIPMFTSCCPAWVKYLEIYYPELTKYLSTCKSPIGMQGSIIKTYYAKINNLDPSQIITVAITPCTAKKAEVNRKEMNSSSKYYDIEELRDTDYVLTTSELALMIRESGIDFSKIKDSKFDSMSSSGGGVIFGSSGGVMESALRTSYYLLNGKNPEMRLLNLVQVRGLNNVKEAEVDLGSKKLNVLVVQGIPNVIPYLEELKNTGTLKYDFIEVMNCIGGCIGGGGQILTSIEKLNNTKESRMAGLYEGDVKRSIRCAHDNPEIIDLYRDFLKNPNSDLAHLLLHTKYKNKSSLLGIEKDNG